MWPTPLPLLLLLAALSLPQCTHSQRLNDSVGVFAGTAAAAAQLGLHYVGPVGSLQGLHFVRPTAAHHRALLLDEV